MAKSSEDPQGETGESRESSPTKSQICGIVMPIAAMGDDYTEEHWRRVRKILQRAVERSGMRAQLVWENPEVDVIQSAILQNLYENDVVICDVSGLNPNVMLETGLRLSTKRPTIIVTDRVQRPPFDISTIGYIEYQRDLEYNAIEDFIDRLSKKITDVSQAVLNNTYKSFVEQFQFETVTPTTINVTSDEYIKEKIGDLAAAIARVERSQRLEFGRNRVARSTAQDVPPMTRQTKLIGEVQARMNDRMAEDAESTIDQMPHIVCSVTKNGLTEFEFSIYSTSELLVDENQAVNEAFRVVRSFERKYLRSHPSDRE